MVVACPKCSRKVEVPAADLASKERLKSLLCQHCGGHFDGSTLLTIQKEPAPPNVPGKSRSTKLDSDEAHPKRRMPKRIGSYEIVAEINRGGMGIVYKAMDPLLRRQVAIKVLLAGEGASEEDIKRFQREAQATARLQHSNIVPIYAVGTHEGKPYFVMDFIEGRTAKQLKEEGKMAPRLALSIIEGVAEALHHAHLNGVIHRDVKPGNILVDQFNRAQLMDFGLARRVDEDLDITQAGTTMGTPSYMAPEQAEGKLTEVDAQSDVYSAGACLYELLTGKPPFDGSTIMSVLRKVVDEMPVPLRVLNPKVHRDVETICMKCLEKGKLNRYASAKQLAEDIRRFNAGEAISAKPLALVPSLIRKARRHKEVTIAALVVVCSALAALGYTVNESRKNARKQIEERERAVRAALDAGKKSLAKARAEVAALSDAGRSEFKERAAHARTALLDAISDLRQAENAAPGSAEVKQALEEAHKLENDLEVRRFIFTARSFLYPLQEQPDGPPVLPNYAGAEFAAQEAVDRDRNNTEAQQLLRLAIGIRPVFVEAQGGAVEVLAKRIMDAMGRTLPGAADDAGKSLGATPVRGRELEPGLYVLSFLKEKQPVQQATLWVSRESKNEDLVVRVTLNTADENMVQIPAGTINLPQSGPKPVATFLIDRFEYPNKAGAIPVTGIATMDAAKKLCESQNKQLCTTAQWLRACMGDGEWRYPYDKNYITGTCASGYDGDAQKRPLASGLFSRCHTPEGVYDMSGNVAEWTDGEQDEKVFGGDWTSGTQYPDLTISCRARNIPESVNKNRLGVRCCRNK